MGDDKTIILGALCYSGIAVCFAIAACSMMIYQVNSESWKNDIKSANPNNLRISDILENNWKARPIVDVRAFRQDELLETSVCPSDYPEDVMYDIWKGTRGMCDCLERPGDRQVYED